MTIDRCYCFGKTFAHLRAVADVCGADSVEALQGCATFGERCRLCHPYVRRMLRTGQTVFHEIVAAEDEPGGGEGKGGRKKEGGKEREDVSTSG